MGGSHGSQGDRRGELVVTDRVGCETGGGVGGERYL